MTAPMGCRLIGRWRIVAADLWERDYLDLSRALPRWTSGPTDTARSPSAPSRTASTSPMADSDVSFDWAGFDQMDEVRGSGSASSSKTVPWRSSSTTSTATRLSQKPNPRPFSSLLSRDPTTKAVSLSGEEGLVLRFEQ